MFVPFRPRRSFVFSPAVLFWALALPGLQAETVSTFATGFNAAAGLAVDTAGNLYVANRNSGVVSKVTSAGVVSAFASGISLPYGSMAFDSAGNLYISSFNTHTVSRITPGGVVSTFASGFSNPAGLAFDTAGNLYVANYIGGTVRKVTPAGVVSVFATGLNFPMDLAFDTAGTLYVSNYGNSTISKVTTSGAVSGFASGLNGPMALAFDAAGILYVGSLNVTTVRKITPAGVVSSYLSTYSAPAGLAFDATGNLFIAVSNVNTVYKVSQSVSPTITGVTGPTAGSYKAGGMLNVTATFNEPVTVTGSPQILFTVGVATQYATYVSGSGTAALVFRYTVQAGDTDADGIATTSSIDLNCGEIDATSSGLPATLTFAAPTTSSVLIDTTAPAITSGASASATYGAAFSSYVIAATDAATITYGASSLPNGLSVNTSSGAITGTPTSAGSYSAAITATDVAGNVASSSVAFTVSQFAPTITWSAPAAITYGTALSSSQLNATASVAGTLSYNPANGTVLLAGSRTLGVIFTPTDTTNYASTIGSVMLTVNPAPLTITAGALARFYGAANPTLTSNISGFVNSETLATSGISGSATVTTAATATTAAGPAAITPALGTLAAANYSFGTFIPGVLTIAKAPLIVTADAQSRDYGSADPTLTATITGFVNSETLASSGITGSTALTNAATASTAVGSVAITPTLGTLAAANYSFTTFVPGTLSITQAPLTVTGVAAADKIYDATATATPVFAAASLSGLAAADTSGVALDTAAVVATFPDKWVGAAKPVTVTGLNISGPTAGNYFLAQPTGVTAAITARTLAVTGVTASNKIYDATATAPISTTSAALIGVVGGDSVTLVASGATGTFANASVGAAKVVTIANLTLTGTDAANYTLAMPSTTAAITLAPASLNLGDLDQVYTGEPVSVSATTVPAGLAVDLVYGGDSTAPVAAGSYSVAGTISDPNYHGTAAATLTIARAAQTIFFAPLDTPTIGSPVALSATASSGLPVTFSLVSGNATVNGATLTTHNSALAIIRATQAGNANFKPATRDQVVNGVSDSRLYAISTRARVGTGGDILIPGIVIGGSGTRQILVRASGPAIEGVSGTLARPQLKLYQVGNPNPIATNIGWSSGSVEETKALQAAFAVANLPPYPAGSADCALLATVNAGSVYTATISGVDETTGVALVEVYEAGAGGAHITALSCRAQIGTGGDILIAGIAIRGTSPKQVIVRAKGPGIAGVDGVLARPTLALYNGGGEKIAANTGWGTAANAAALAGASAAVGLSPLAVGAADSAILTTVAPGGYTVHVSGIDGATGVALIEVYEVP